MKQITTYSALVLLLIMSFSCDNRRPIIGPEDNKALVKFTIDWGSIDFAPNGWSVYIYPKSYAGKHTSFISQAASETVILHRGTYSVIAINDTEQEYKHITFSGTDKYDTFTATATPLKELSKALADDLAEGEEPQNSPDALAVYRLAELEITDEMVSKYKTTGEVTKEILVRPSIVGYLTTIMINVKGVDNASLGSSLVAATGLSSKINLSTRESSGANGTQFIPITKRIYNESNMHWGKLVAETYVFGLYDIDLLTRGGDNLATKVGTDYQTVRLYATLRNGKPHPMIHFTAKGKIDFFTNDYGFEELVYNLGLDKYGIPETELPDVIGPEEEQGGFDAEVEGWGEEIETEVGV